jgi:menaquinone-dependent protoporphyrinogen IX oxidase
MRAVVVYESMFGNTRRVAEAIADGISQRAITTLVPIAQLREQPLPDADLVVVGAPTHMHGLSRQRSRRIAETIATKPDHKLTLEPGAAASGIREWLDTVGVLTGDAAAFDTRGMGLSLFTGRAATSIQRRLRRHGARIVASCRSFVVGANHTVDAAQLERARVWGEQLVEASIRRRSLPA